MLDRKASVVLEGEEGRTGGRQVTMTESANIISLPLFLFLHKIRLSFLVGSLAPPGLKVPARTRVKGTL